MSSEKVDEAKETEDPKPAPLQSVLKSKSKDAVNEETNKSKRVVFQEKPVIINKTVTKNVENTKKEVVEIDKQKDKKDRYRPPTKVVVRRLPPTMTLDVFIEYVSPMPDHDFIYFVPADMSLGSNAFARVYINFLNMDDLITFHDQFDNYVFMDNKGNEYPAVVEFAQFQRIPKKRQGKKRDLKAGTLKDDQEYNAFLEMLRERKEANAAKQTIDVPVPTDKPAPKITTTPLLDYIKQKRAEQQRLRDERREERRRKELERKRIKDEEKKRRKDAESVLKVLRSHDTEDHEDSKSGKDIKEVKEKDIKVIKEKDIKEKDVKEKDVKEKDLKEKDVKEKDVKEKDVKEKDVKEKDIKEKEWSPSPQGTQSNKRKEDDKLKQREEKKKEKPILESRTREVKNRENAAKSYRDERQKLAEGRIQRKLADDQRKKVVIERNQMTNRSGDNHSQESEKPIFSKDTHMRKTYLRDIESKRLSNNAKDEKNTKEPESKRSYRDVEGRRQDRYMYVKDPEHKRSTYSSERRKSVSSGYESEWRKRLVGVKAQEKEVRTKQVVDIADEKLITSSPEQENEKEEQRCETPQSPEKSSDVCEISEAMTHQQDNKKSFLKRSCSVGSSTRSVEVEKDGKIISDIKTNAIQSLKRSSSLDLSSVSVVHESRETDTISEQNTSLVHSQTDVIPEQNTSLVLSQSKEDVSKNDSHTERSSNCDSEDSDEEKANTTTEKSAPGECETVQQNDQNINTEGDIENHRETNQTETQENEGNQNKEADSTQITVANEQLSDECSRQEEDQMMNDTKVTHSVGVSSVAGSGNAPANSGGSENKRDPRVERRIRNKDRPSIEIYRPGMGRFSMQRKEREKSAATTTTTATTTTSTTTPASSSSVEQDSPSTSPSPSPSLRPISTNRSRAGQELRSMTFKRSVSREK